MSNISGLAEVIIVSDEIMPGLGGWGVRRTEKRTRREREREREMRERGGGEETRQADRQTETQRET